MSKSNPRVFLGVGHGGKDPGAVANGLREADVNLTVALAVQVELVRHGCTVLLSRYTDANDSLADEILEANAFAPDLAVDIHHNAGGGDGFEAYHQTNSCKSASKALAQCIEAEVKKLGQNSRGIKTRLSPNGTDYFGFLRQVKTTAVLLEGAFLDTVDRYIIDTVPEQQDMGIAYAKGILTSLGIAWQPQGTCSHSKLEQENKELQATVKAQSALLRQFKALATQIQ